MLEEALKRDSSGNSKDVGWRRWSSREGEQREHRFSDDRPYPEPSNSIDSTSSTATMNSQNSPIPATAPPDNRFFKFRFSGSNSSSRPGSRPNTPSPVLPSGGLQHHLTSASVPSLPQQISPKEMEELTAELDKERSAHQKAKQDKEALEAEIESLSQALFEEVNASRSSRCSLC